LISSLSLSHIFEYTRSREEERRVKENEYAHIPKAHPLRPSGPPFIHPPSAPIHPIAIATGPNPIVDIRTIPVRHNTNRDIRTRIPLIKSPRRALFNRRRGLKVAVLVAEGGVAMRFVVRRGFGDPRGIGCWDWSWSWDGGDEGQEPRDDEKLCGGRERGLSGEWGTYRFG